MDEEDYMSDIFVTPTPDSSLLPLSKIESRKRKIEKNRSDSDLKSKIKPKHVLEREQREKGLATSLSCDNLGFKLMEKMGYKQGEGLGKNKKGRAEPVPITLRGSRTGLGKEAADKAKLNTRKRLLNIVAEKKLKLENIQRRDFRARMSQKYNLQQSLRDLGKSQKVCYDLDCKEGMEEPVYDFFWSNYSAEDEDENFEQYSVDDQLSMLTGYLREQYLYCIWCGTKYDNVDDLLNHCPGDNASAHED